MDENHASGALISMSFGCQNAHQLENLKILSIFQGHKDPHEQNFWNLIFFSSGKTRLHRYYQNKNQLVVTSSSYLNLTMKLLIKSYLLAKKQGKSKILLFIARQFLTFASNRLSIFSGLIELQGMTQVILENQQWQIKITIKLHLLKCLSNFELPLRLSGSEIDTEVIISRKYNCNTIVWAKVMHPGHFAQNK